MPTYKVQRVYCDHPGVKRTLKRGLTLEQAQAHCSDPETRSSTCTLAVNRRRTAKYGPWCDRYTEEQ